MLRSEPFYGFGDACKLVVREAALGVANEAILPRRLRALVFAIILRAATHRLRQLFPLRLPALGRLLGGCFGPLPRLRRQGCGGGQLRQCVAVCAVVRNLGRRLLEESGLGLLPRRPCSPRRCRCLGVPGSLGLGLLLRGHGLLLRVCKRLLTISMLVPGFSGKGLDVRVDVHGVSGSGVVFGLAQVNLHSLGTRRRNAILS